MQKTKKKHASLEKGLFHFKHQFDAPFFLEFVFGVDGTIFNVFFEAPQSLGSHSYSDGDITVYH